MDKEDIYYYFLVEAILNTNSKLLFLYSRNDDILFRIKNINNFWLLSFYNEDIRTELYLKREKEIYKLIDRFTQKDSSIYELNTIDESQKQNFINQYINSISNKDCKDELRMYLSTYNLRDNERIVGKILGDTFLGIDYSHKLWSFLEKTIILSYYSLGISLASKVYL